MEEQLIHQGRIFQHSTEPGRPGPVLYWMSRDQRAGDNWALVYSREKAMEYKTGLGVVFCLSDTFLGATARQYLFMLEGLHQVEQDLYKKNIAFYLVRGKPGRAVPELVSRIRAGLLVTDFDPLDIKQQWQSQVIRQVTIPVHEVDAHNIVPCRRASDKREYAAYTIRPKIHRLLPEYLTPFPTLKPHPYPAQHIAAPDTDWARIKKAAAVSGAGPEHYPFRPGEAAARSVLDTFIKTKLDAYAQARNDPAADGVSNLSPYLHFGQISAQAAALAVEEAAAHTESKEAFLEELIVRRELADNFCFYDRKYEGTGGFSRWAKETLSAHENDPREYVYTPDEFEQARTHDSLWNACQMQMVKAGKMHGYMRMYWAKKILEWSPSPKEAMETALYLNNRYELDGRDPNGYTGVAWAIGGVHDRAWFQRPVFGKVRYMNRKGCEKKFDTAAYIEKINNL